MLPDSRVDSIGGDRPEWKRIQESLERAEEKTGINNNNGAESETTTAEPNKVSFEPPERSSPELKDKLNAHGGARAVTGADLFGN